MLAKFCGAILLAVGGAALAAEIQCPPGTLPDSRQSAGGVEAWCELEADRSLLHGPYLAWYASGILGSEENYVRGKAEGKAVYHWGSGHKQAEGRYREGLRDGTWTFWDKTGARAGRVRYRKGTVVAGRLPKWAVEWDEAPAAEPAPAQQ